MNKPDLMAELAEVVRLLDDMQSWIGPRQPDARDAEEREQWDQIERAKATIRTHHAKLEAVVRDAALLDFQERECITVRCEAADDDDVFYDAVSYHMAEPKERVIGTGTTPREALIQAMHNSAREWLS